MRAKNTTMVCTINQAAQTAMMLLGARRGGSPVRALDMTPYQCPACQGRVYATTVVFAAGGVLMQRGLRCVACDLFAPTSDGTIERGHRLVEFVPVPDAFAPATLHSLLRMRR